MKYHWSADDIEVEEDTSPSHEEDMKDFEEDDDEPTAKSILTALMHKSEIISPRNVLESILAKFNPYHDERGRFSSADAAVEQMKVGKVVATKDLGAGANKPVLATLDNGVMVVEKSVTFKGQDAASAAVNYEISKAIGFNNFPATTLTNDGKVRQIFLNEKGDAHTLKGVSSSKMKKMYDESKWKDEYQMIAAMDFIRHSDDRHGGNILLDKDGKPWGIDSDSFAMNSRSEWVESRKGLSKAMSDVELTPKVKGLLEKFIKNAPKLYDKEFTHGVPEKEWSATVRRAQFMVKTGKIP